MAKPPFPLLALPFMHVIPVPAPSPLSLLPTLAFLSTLLCLPSVFSYYCTSSLPIWENYSIFAAFPVFSLHAEMLLLSFRPWPNSGGSDLRKGMKGRPLEASERRQVSLCVPLPPVCPSCIKYRVMQGWVWCSFSLITCQWAWASEADEVKATIT